MDKKERENEGLLPNIPLQRPRLSLPSTSPSSPNCLSLQNIALLCLYNSLLARFACIDIRKPTVGGGEVGVRVGRWGGQREGKACILDKEMVGREGRGGIGRGGVTYKLIIIFTYPPFPDLLVLIM